MDKPTIQDIYENIAAMSLADLLEVIRQLGAEGQLEDALRQRGIVPSFRRGPAWQQALVESRN